MHLMAGNLSFQIEHHLFPDLPSNRYQEIAPKVEEVFERYGLTYVSGPLPQQVASAWKKVFRLSLPNDAAEQVAELPQKLVKSALAPFSRFLPGAPEPVAEPELTLVRERASEREPQPTAVAA